MNNRLLGSTLLSAMFAVAAPATAQSGSGSADTFDVSVPPGANYDRAEFRLWLPGSGKVRAAVVLVPGSNGDWRSMVQDSVWQDFARRNAFALVGVRLTDKQHEQSFIEEYVDVRRGSGQALLDALGALSVSSAHAELRDAPLLLWGMSAGGQFNYEFVAWKPERVIAFVVNKGGIYYSALVPREARAVPGILFIGGRDLEFRTNTIVGLFAVNRRAGALWALSNEPDAGHTVGGSRDVAIPFFEDIAAMRLGNAGAVGATSGLQPVPEGSGFIGDLSEHTWRPLADAPVPNRPTAWLPTERVARAWSALAAGTGG